MCQFQHGAHLLCQCKGVSDNFKFLTGTKTDKGRKCCTWAMSYIPWTLFFFPDEGVTNKPPLPSLKNACNF